MSTLIFATGNPHKVSEVNQVLSDGWEVRSLAEMGITEELPENQDTLEGNALEKARYVYAILGEDCFAEDTGLEIEALGGEPGVLTARYAGDSKDPDANMKKALVRLEGATNRHARFRTVIALILDGDEFLFEGIASGSILLEKSGTGGFGYDPIFQPEGFEESFAEMDATTKNRISHRGKAVRQLIAFLEDRTSKSPR
ncbi:MAG: RdgB/HAM1 family non-canonical purine NTP pyrophosphatase [Saprospirales bacterium]|nr:RdgB/HAM1 family non-canonical purine NTP pyrophosphatase [Saprospirales bacterium]MBK8492510.1 RdgB/HAM1 family non-canonical purine NTP pyrophosphatase [Saprospirales bacterium]